jgi:hypothetical protein
MMFHGLGDDNSAAAAALASGPNIQLVTVPKSNPNADLTQCSWCANNKYIAWANPACWDLNEQICSPISQAWASSAVPGAPPPQEQINAQTPQETIDQIVASASQAGIEAATQAAAEQGSYVPAAPNVVTVCTQGAAQYNAFLCFMKQNSGMIFTAGLIMTAFVLLSPAKGHR